MNSASLVFVGAVMSLSCLNASPWVMAQQPAQQSISQDATVTLYSGLKYRAEQRQSCINFEVAPTALFRVPCDLRYGSLYVDDDLDWFQSSTAERDRSVLKDLGEHNWSTWFEVPVVEPLAQLKPGEKRIITVDASGADGGAKRDGNPKVGPLFAKAIVGHVYVIHVMDDARDFYALVRVEALQKGDNCIVSWKLIPAPVNQTGKSTPR